jgi:hypothetical protein
MPAVISPLYASLALQTSFETRGTPTSCAKAGKSRSSRAGVAPACGNVDLARLGRGATVEDDRGVRGRRCEGENTDVAIHGVRVVLVVDLHLGDGDTVPVAGVFKVVPV